MGGYVSGVPAPLKLWVCAWWQNCLFSRNLQRVSSYCNWNIFIYNLKTKKLNPKISSVDFYTISGMITMLKIRGQTRQGCMTTLNIRSDFSKCKKVEWEVAYLMYYTMIGAEWVIAWVCDFHVSEKKYFFWETQNLFKNIFCMLYNTCKYKHFPN